MRGVKRNKNIDFTLAEPIEKNTEEAVIKKGRSTKLLERRNEKLVARYCFYNVVCKLSYDKVVERLVDELDLNDRTISDIIDKYTPTISIMKRAGVDVKKLKETYPYYSWVINN